MRILWHTFVIFVLVLLPGWVLFSLPVWALSPSHSWLIVGVAGSYIISALGAKFSPLLTRYPIVLASSAIVATCLAAIFLGVLLLEISQYSRLLLIVSSMLLAGGVFAHFAGTGLRIKRLHFFLFAGFFLAATIVLQLAVRKIGISTTNPDIRTLNASQYILTATYYGGYVPDDGQVRVSGGAIAPDPTVRGSYLLVTARGTLYRLSWDTSDRLRVQNLGLQVPINSASFEEEVSDDVPRNSFRVADIAIRANDIGADIFVSHHYWKREEGCVVVRVSRATMASNAEQPGGLTNGWRTVFESSPCLAIGPARGTAFAGEQIGGNLEFLDSRNLLLTVGDHQFDGWYRPTNLIQDPNAHYGKTVLIDTETGKASIFTTGHRNPQGLTTDSLGRIWETEHGPQGGDELNMLVKGSDYGYPSHTYGTEYGSVTWPLTDSLSGQMNSIRPVFAWVPSIGISEIVAVDDPAFERWRGDLLIASLRAKSLWRIRLEGQRVVYTEPIPIGERVRDIATGSGEFVLWTDSDTIVRIRPSNAISDGSILFTLRCGGCHDDQENRIGPNLKEVLGRRIASAKGYNYSPGLSKVGGNWTEDRLDAFLNDTSSFAPGTTMAIERISDPEMRRLIIDYIKRVPD